MNAFLRHHHDHIALHYSCFDRILCNGYVVPLLYAPSAAAFLYRQRQAKAVTPAYLRGLANDYHRWLEAEATRDNLPILTPPKDVRRHEWVEPYYQALAAPTGLAALLKCREPARLLVQDRGTHEFQRATRHVFVYYFYLRDAQFGRFFLRLCPYYPFDAQVCLNGHEWLAGQLTHERIGFRKVDNLFAACAAPDRLQQLADTFGPAHIRAAVDPWLERWLPFFSAQERAQGYRHQWYLTQVEYCTNLIFHRDAALDRLFNRLLDSNRTLGQPAKLAVIFGRPHFHPDTRTAFQEVKVTPLKTTVVKTGYQKTWHKQYVKDCGPGQGGAALRSETTSDHVPDLGLKKNLDNLPRAREVLERSNERYLDAQQDILLSTVDRGQLEALRQPTVSESGRRTPGLRIDDGRLLALLRAVTCFVYLVGRGGFRTKDLLEDMQRTMARPEYRLSQLRYDLGKLRAKGLVQRLPGTQRYELSREGYQLAVLYQKLQDRVYAPLTASIVAPVPSDNQVLTHRQTKLDRRYAAVDKALDAVFEAADIAA